MRRPLKVKGTVEFIKSRLSKGRQLVASSVIPISKVTQSRADVPVVLSVRVIPSSLPRDLTSSESVLCPPLLKQRSAMGTSLIRHPVLAGRRLC